MGFLKYRNPTIIETIALVKIIREFFVSEDLIGAKFVIMENIKNLLDYSELNGIESFEDLNKHSDEMTGALYRISDEILNKVIGAFGKKN
jgi:hypothetical protein